MHLSPPTTEEMKLAKGPSPLAICVESAGFAASPSSTHPVRAWLSTCISSAHMELTIWTQGTSHYLLPYMRTCQLDNAR